MEYFTRGPCGQEGCRERRYHLDNGLWFCRRGHLQEGRQIEEDAEDFGTQGKVSRVKKESQERARKTIRGREAITLFLQVYQFILWKQCHSLVHGQGFPEQMEGIVRDLWALRLRTYSSRMTQFEEDDDNHHDDIELFSSQASHGDSSDGMRFKAGSQYIEWPRMLDTVAVCYMAALLMRLPVCVNDLHCLIVRQDILYIRALRAIPRETRDKLPPEFINILDIHRLPEIEHLHRGCQELILYYRRRFELALPPLNSPVIIYRHIKRLAIPIDVYDIIKTLQGLLGFSLEYMSTGGRKKQALHLPEVQIMVLIVISTKLLFPFDGISRNPTTSKEPGAQAMDWGLWASAQKQFNNSPPAGGNIGKEKLIQVSDTDILGMDPAQLDEYMDWYEKNWQDTPKTTTSIADLFPTSRPEAQSEPEPESAPSEEEHSLNKLLRTVMEGLTSIAVSPDRDDGCARPGNWYRRYRWESSLHENARPFFELAAQLAGVSLSTLIRAVSVSEWRLASWQEKRRRPDQTEGTPDIIATDNDGEDSDGEENSDHDVNEGNLQELQGQLRGLDV